MRKIDTKAERTSILKWGKENGTHNPVPVAPKTLFAMLDRIEYLESSHRLIASASHAIVERAETAERERDTMLLALQAAEGWITMADHGDNCYLDEDHDLGKGCHCGQDSILNHISGALLRVAPDDEQERERGEQ